VTDADRQAIYGDLGKLGRFTGVLLDTAKF